MPSSSALHVAHAWRALVQRQLASSVVQALSASSPSSGVKWGSLQQPPGRFEVLVCVHIVGALAKSFLATPMLPSRDLCAAQQYSCHGCFHKHLLRTEQLFEGQTVPELLFVQVLPRLVPAH
eukprot:1157572-Pelagomonas_calceolata.AAC.1